MIRLGRHVALHVSSAVLLVLVVLLGLFAVSELADAPEGSRFVDTLHYVVLKLPGWAVANTGFAMLIGCLMGLGVLASQSELTVMRASGISVLHVAWMVMRPMLALMLLVSWLGEYAVPSVERRASQLRAEVAEQGSMTGTLAGDSGLWLRQGNDFLHFRTILPGGTIYGFSRLSFDERGELQFAQYAARGLYQPGEGQPGWQLEDVRVTRFTPEGIRTDAGEVASLWQTELAPDILSVVVTEPGSMSLRELYRYMNYLEEQSQDINQFRLVFWQKALQPLSMMGLVLVAISFVFGPLRSTTVGYRLFTGIVVGIVFRFAQDLLGPTSLVYHFSPLLAVSVPIVLCWVIGIVLLVRTR